MNDFARRERLALADLLSLLGPDQPTLCTGWTTRDLAAHLVVRERRPDAALGIQVTALHEHGEKVRRAKAALPFEQILKELRTPPWWSPVSNRATDELFNAGEFYIHHEDARRAQPTWVPRDLGDDQQRSLWGQAKFSARMVLGRAKIPVRLHADGYGTHDVGTDPQITVAGPPSELTLYLAGRRDAARIDLDGSPDALDRLRRANLNL